VGFFLNHANKGGVPDAIWCPELLRPKAR
jgi:hypothetical protein